MWPFPTSPAEPGRKRRTPERKGTRSALIHIPVILKSLLLSRSMVVQSREVLLADMGVFPQHCFEWLCDSSQIQRCSKNRRPLPCIYVPPWGQLHCLGKAHYIASSLHKLGPHFIIWNPKSSLCFLLSSYFHFFLKK